MKYIVVLSMGVYIYYVFYGRVTLFFANNI